MSSSNDFSAADAARPTHHVHGSNDPLPGAKRGVNAVDYSAETIERTPSTWNERTEEQFAREQPGLRGATSEDRHHGHHDNHGEGHHGSRTDTSEQRPMDDQPTHGGGVAVGANANTSESKPSVIDKVVGKTQKIVGKATHKSEMHEKGELRETGGKAASQGALQTPHD
ncbi:hypothetical protein GGU10DRAFT_399715 [Lentinula aff. detonsa]|uniref:Uncharacterized protein n=1 Tax=Lentinula aff. detonsa TaxID=2804958 RepID=A0AA38KFZ2_9AGAR|nr:hypothetical protein GGU10DRAFT_399715 [Lentinula aff. detonsa]